MPCAICVTFSPTTLTAEDSGGSICVSSSASGDLNHQAAACSARPNNVSYGYGSPGVCRVIGGGGSLGGADGGEIYGFGVLGGGSSSGGAGGGVDVCCCLT